MKTRGMGFCFLPSYTDRHGVRKVSAVWWISYSVHGKRTKESSESTNRADAVRLLKRRIAEVQQGKAVGSQVEKTTLGDLLNLIIDDYKVNGNRSLRRLEVACRHLRDGLGADTRAVNITSAETTRYVAARLEEGAAKATVNMEICFLHRGFKLAVRAGKASSIPEMEMLKLNNSRAGFFEVEQFRAVLRHLPPHLRGFAVTAYYTGWRKRELTSRLWKHIDLRLGILRLEPGESKNNEARTFPLFEIPELRQVIETERARVSEIERRTGRIISHVFVNDDGHPLVDFRRSWATATKLAGAPGRLIHDLRRTAVRNFERAGLPRSVSMKLSGHRTEAVFRRYAIVDPTMLNEGVAKLAAMSAMSEENSQRRIQDIALLVKKR